MTKLNQENVAGIVNKRYPGVFKFQTSGGNVQVMFESLKAQNDEDKARFLVAICDDLRAEASNPP